MQIGVISDTHDHHRNVRRAIQIFSEEAVQYVLHAGDITSACTIDLFAGLQQARLIAVFGNCDADRRSLGTAIETVGGEVHSDSYRGQIDGRTIYMTHKPDSIGAAIDGGAYDLVVHGHTHRQDIRRLGRALVINPGAATNWMGLPGHIVLLNTADMTTTIRRLDS
ncbi:MAG: YfcE family phosphodiesterase [Sedimentisphaerales bacterium]|nr:YfcE family phosphodiesterase [Sedimentisphaerales bacterium]